MKSLLRSLIRCCWAFCAAARLWAGDPGNPIGTSPDDRNYRTPQSVGGQFPESVYGIGHSGSNFWFVPATGTFGNPDYSKGSFHYYSAPFYPRNSEGVYGAIVWIEKQDANGEWNPIMRGDKLLSTNYQYINTPNPGPSEGFSAEWDFDPLEPNQNYRLFGYVYMYNQGGGDQGAFALSSTLGPINTGPANDPPRVRFANSSFSTNPTQFRLGQSYLIKAEAEDDNSNLSVVRIWKNGAPFAFGDASGAAGSSENTTSDSTPGTVTFTAQAEDLRGAVSDTITWTVEILDRSDQPAVSSENAGILLGQSFTPAYHGGAGSGGWQFAVAGSTGWDGSASNNTGTQLPGNVWSASWTPPTPGNYTFYISRNGDDDYKASSIAGPYTLTVYGTPTVAWTSTPPAQVSPGTPLQWAAQASSPNVPSGAIELHFDLSTDGGASWVGNAYQYASNAWSNVVIAGASGTLYIMRATVNDGTLGSNGFVAAIYHSVVVAANVQNVSLSPMDPTITAGSSINLSAAGGQNGYVWGGSASGTGANQTLTFNTPGAYVVSVYSPAGGAFSQSNTASTTVTVLAATQSVSLDPATSSIWAGQLIVFTASGGRNGYIWTGTTKSDGSTQNVRFNTPGTYTLTLYSPAGGIYNQSNIATATVTVLPVAQTVSIAPPSTNLFVGQSVTFSAAGGQNGYVWGGSASGTGANQTLTFNTPGIYAVSAYSPTGGIYGRSNIATATASVTVGSNPLLSQPPTARLYAEQGTLRLGSSTIIRASYAPGANDTLGATSIDAPEGNLIAGNDGTAAVTRVYTFKPTTPGMYVFYARIQTPRYPLASYAATTVEVLGNQYTLTVEVSGPGSVSPLGSTTFESGYIATVSATWPDPTRFAGWQGAATGTAPVINIMMDGNKSVTAVFTGKSAQTITFLDPGSLVVGQLYDLQVSATSGLPVTLTLTTGLAELTGTASTGYHLRALAPGAIAITASQPGDAEFLPAPNVVQTINGRAYRILIRQESDRIHVLRGDKDDDPTIIIGRPL